MTSTVTPSQPYYFNQSSDILGCSHFYKYVAPTGLLKIRNFLPACRQAGSLFFIRYFLVILS
jgi:hypothetical protein